MAWTGYFEYDGTEIVNIDRASTYARNYGMYWLKCVGSTALGLMLGETYNSPAIDDAPWVDPDRPESFDFYGTYPLDVNGLEDSTIEASITESVLDGGVVNRPRRATRPIVYSLALMGANDRGVEYGMRWLKTALSGAACKGLVDCTGANLCYLSSEPVLDVGIATDLESCMDPLLRTLHKVTITTGPTITGKFPMPSGGEVWTVSFTAVAGDPYEFMIERPLIEGFLSASPSYVNPDYPPASPPHPWIETAGVVTDEYACNPAEYRPLYDPNCPLVIPPPGVPSVAVSCFNFPVTFTRRFFTIPEEEVPLWGTTVPIITFRTGQEEARNIRLRFYADVMGTGDPEQDPCAYCGDIVFSWIPAGSTMVLDGTKRQVIVQTPGQPLRRADAVVFKSDGTPFDWPELTCGFSYLAVVDRPTTDTSDLTMDMSLVNKVL